MNGVKTGDVIEFDNVGYSIPADAFNGNTDLLNIATVPNVTAGDGCFAGCTFLTSTGSVITAGNGCFAGCTFLTSIGSVVTAGDFCFSNCTSLTSTGSVITAGDFCFESCTNITSTGSVITAGDFCFVDCTSLTSTGSVITAGNGCFAGCTSLITINFTNTNNIGTTTGGDNVFENISGLTITVTAKTIHQTSNAGGLEGDLAYLDANNTVTFNWV